jgi:hypothetical protein
LKRIYFYKDEEGVLRRYYYCSLCGKGPFMEKQLEDGVFFIRGHGSQPTITCRMCDVLVYPKFDRPKLASRAVQVEGTPTEEILVEEIPKADLKEDSIENDPIPELEEETGHIEEEIVIKNPVTKIVDITDNDSSVVKAGQIWKDKDKRRKRTIRITRVKGKQAFYIGGVGKTEICIAIINLMKRFKKGPSMNESAVESPVMTAETPVTVPEASPVAAPVITPVKTTVTAGQVWKDKDRRRNRTIKILRVEGGSAYYVGGRKDAEVRVSTKRLVERFKFVS